MTNLEPIKQALYHYLSANADDFFTVAEVRRWLAKQKFNVSLGMVRSALQRLHLRRLVAHETARKRRGLTIEGREWTIYTDRPAIQRAKRYDRRLNLTKK